MSQHPSPAQRLARATSGRPVDPEAAMQEFLDASPYSGPSRPINGSKFVAWDVESLPHLPAEAAINARNARVEAAAKRWRDGTEQLLATLDNIAADEAVDAAVEAMDTIEVPVTAGDVTVVHRGRIPRHRTIYLAAVLAGFAMLAGIFGIGSTPTAQAAVWPISQPIAVTVSGPYARISTDVVSTSPRTPGGEHAVLLTDGPLALIGTSHGTGAAIVHIAAQVPSRMLTPGITTATLTDLGDGSVRRVTVQVRRQSKVTLTQVIPLPGAVLVMGVSAHYDITTGGWKGDLASPVIVQATQGGKTVSVTTWTAPDGSVCAVIPAKPGKATVRLVRQPGLNVTGGSSSTRTAAVTR